LTVTERSIRDIRSISTEVRCADGKHIVTSLTLFPEHGDELTFTAGGFYERDDILRDAQSALSHSMAPSAFAASQPPD
jgi:hypothetical protein